MAKTLQGRRRERGRAAAQGGGAQDGSAGHAATAGDDKDAAEVSLVGVGMRGASRGTSRTMSGVGVDITALRKQERKRNGRRRSLPHSFYPPGRLCQAERYLPPRLAASSE